jgi:hypothetical protein
MNIELNKDAVKSIREHYHCNGKYLCPNFYDCKFGDGYNTSYDCCECGADEYYEGYMQCLFDKEREL